VLFLIASASIALLSFLARSLRTSHSARAHFPARFRAQLDLGTIYGEFKKYPSFPEIIELGTF
jgi:hypothetical protein